MTSPQSSQLLVIPELVPGIQMRRGSAVCPVDRRFWMAGTSPAMTIKEGGP